MNAMTELLTSSYKPVVAITVFRATNEVSGQGEYYLESHDITEEGQVMAGKPLQVQTLTDMVDVFFDERKNQAVVKGILTENILGYANLPGGNYRLVWYRPEELRVVHFTAQHKIPTTKCCVPATVYVADRNSLDVYALKSNTRPKENTKLMHAPYFNVADDGGVCLGSAKVDKPKELTYSNLMKYWEDLFWLSEFSHLNGDEKVKSGKLAPLWKKIAASKGKLKWSALDELKPYKNLQLQNVL